MRQPELQKRNQQDPGKAWQEPFFTHAPVLSRSGRSRDKSNSSYAEKHKPCEQAAPSPFRDTAETCCLQQVSGHTSEVTARRLRVGMRMLPTTAIDHCCSVHHSDIGCMAYSVRKYPMLIQLLPRYLRLHSRRLNCACLNCTIYHSAQNRKKYKALLSRTRNRLNLARGAAAEPSRLVPLQTKGTATSLLHAQVQKKERERAREGGREGGR